MSNYKAFDIGFKLMPFIQSKTDFISFILTSPFNDEAILNCFIELEDYNSPDSFFEILSVALDCLSINSNRILYMYSHQGAGRCSKHTANM